MKWNVVNEVEPAIQRSVETDPNLTKWWFSPDTACKYLSSIWLTSILQAVKLFFVVLLSTALIVA